MAKCFFESRKIGREERPVTAKCSKTMAAGCANWGVLPGGFEVCSAHFDGIQDAILVDANGKKIDKYLKDYARIYILMENQDGFLDRLRRLDVQADSVVNDLMRITPPDPNYMRLSSILQVFEHRCWFWDDLLLPLGLLSNAVFAALVSLGYHLKDYGAGVKHGEFTHRLQWHVIMRAITSDFSKPDPAANGWDHTPFELYTSLGKAGSLWNFLLDNSGDGDKRSMRFPDWAHQKILADAGLKTIGGMITRREVKRREEFVILVKKYIKDHPAEFGKGAPDLMKAATDTHAGFKRFDDDVAQALYATQPTTKQAAVIYNGFGQPAKQPYEQKKSTAGPSAGPGHVVKRPRPAYQAATFDGIQVIQGVFKLTSTPLADAAKVAAQVKLSYGGFRKDPPKFP